MVSEPEYGGNMTIRIKQLDCRALSSSEFLAFCRKAEKALAEAREVTVLPEVLLFQYALQTYTDCMKSPANSGSIPVWICQGARRTLEVALYLLIGKLRDFSGKLAEADYVLLDVARWSDYYADRLVRRKKS